MLIGLTADLHLGKKLGPRVDAAGENLRSRDFEAAASQVVDGFIAQRCDAVVFAGDLFDAAKPPERARQFLIAELQRLRAALPDALIMLLRGNHDGPMSLSDTTAVTTTAAAVPGCVVADDYRVAQVEHAGVAFTLVPWMSSDEQFLRTVAELQPAAGRHNLLVLHCGLSTLHEFAAMTPGSQTLTPALVPAGFEQIFSGHFHEHRRIAEHGWTFIGSTERTSISDRSVKGFLTYDTDSGAIVQHAIRTRPWYDLGPIDARSWDGQRLLVELAAVRDGIPDWTSALVRLRVRHLRPDVLAALDRGALREITSSAFWCDAAYEADDPLLGELAEAGADGPLFDDLVEEWSRFAASLEGRSSEDIALITRIGAAALTGGSIDEALGVEPAAEAAPRAA